MRIHLVLGALPAFVAYGAELPDGVAGDARGPFVRITAGRDLDKGLLMHELAHVAQFWGVGILTALVTGLSLFTIAPLVLWHMPPWGPILAIAFSVTFALFGTHFMLYRLFRSYRLWAEVMAYREQVLHPDGKGGRLNFDGAARRLMNPRYRLGLTLEQARAALNA